MSTLNVRIHYRTICKQQQQNTDVVVIIILINTQNIFVVRRQTDLVINDDVRIHIQQHPPATVRDFIATVIIYSVCGIGVG